MIITPQDKRKDVSNIFICMYNGKHVGLFKKRNWSTNKTQSWYDAGSIYVGVDSNYIGMKKAHRGSIEYNKWEPIGTRVMVDEKCYIANCSMQNGMSFDDMRLIMYGEGQIKAYEIGKANSEEILEVLKFAASYYQLDQNVRNTRKKQ